jgi:hypothetical protein
MNLIDNTFILEREKLYKQGILTKTGQRSIFIKRKIGGEAVYEHHDAVWLYVKRPAGLLNWYGRKLCGVVDIYERNIYIWKYYNECYKILEHMPFFESYNVIIKDGRDIY